MTIGLTVRFLARCALSGCVPKNSKGYSYAVLELDEGDKYTGAGVIEPGTTATVIDYASHGTGTRDYPIVRVKGKAAVVHPRLLEAAA